MTSRADRAVSRTESKLEGHVTDLKAQNEALHNLVMELEAKNQSLFSRCEFLEQENRQLRMQLSQPSPPSPPSPSAHKMVRLLTTLEPQRMQELCQQALIPSTVVTDLAPDHQPNNDAVYSFTRLEGHTLSPPV
ncbi:hypothetical protein DFS34DRAFT_688512 [Phlyctochytrium arcticum]|nr:hypothetical protein DFS34DRAFT_688512 [Phlyctochytrium arcticum]